MRDHRLTITILIAVLVLIGTSTAMLLLDPRVTSAGALRTAGFAAGSIVAMYALWLNDRRRQVEEQRQELDRERVSDEHFARAVELLGNEADQVRVGALHALAGLARNRPDYTQTVLDVLCAYLRKPINHPKWEQASEEDDPALEADPTLEAERYVRETAQRLILELLPTTDTAGPTAYDLDLSQAWLERFNLSGRVIGRLAAYRCRLRHTTVLTGAVFHGPVSFRDSHFLGRIRSDGAVFHRTLELRGIQAMEPVSFNEARFEGEVNFRWMTCSQRWFFPGAEFHAGLDLRHSRFDAGADLHLQRSPTSTWTEDTLVRTSENVRESRLPQGWRMVPVADSEHASVVVDTPDQPEPP